MKFGKQLVASQYEPWQDKYMPYARFKRLLSRKKFMMDKEASERKAALKQAAGVVSSPASPGYGTYVDPEVELQQRMASETTPLKTAASPEVEEASLQPDISHANLDEFFLLLEAELKKVDEFFLEKLAELKDAVNHFKRLSHHAYSSDRGTTWNRLQQVFTELTALRDYATLNVTAFRKIVKKYDKTMGTDALPQFMARLETHPIATSTEPQALIEVIESMVSRDKLLQLEQFARHQRSKDKGEILPAVKIPALLVAVGVFVFTANVKLLQVDDPFADRCLAVLAFVVTLWITEALPYFATALLVPVLVVFMDVMRDPKHKHHPMSRVDAANFVLDHLVNHTTILILGGYAISAAFSRCKLEMWIASQLQKYFGHSPKLFILSIMFLGLILSMWISNHTAPVLCCSILMPVIRDYPTDSPFVKALLLGLAFGSNFGGMTTPIASMQNVLAVTYLDAVGLPVSFGEWILVALPFCIIGVLISWVVIITAIPPKDVDHIHVIMYTPDEAGLKPRDIAVIVLSLGTILLWSTFAYTSDTFGDLGIIALCFVVLVFGSGMLTEVDFNSFSWHTLFLLGGGNVLGKAVSDSRLLNYISEAVIEQLPLQYPWAAMLCIMLFTCVVSTFVSHTVAAIILMPLIVSIGVELGAAKLLVIGAAFAVSGAMALPFSSFPNINMMLMLDDFQKPYLGTMDYVKTGTPMTIISVIMVVSIGYGLIALIVGV